MSAEVVDVEMESSADEEVVTISSSDIEVISSSSTTKPVVKKPVKAGKHTDPSLLPWVEKYRPAVLGDLISHQDITSTIQKFIDMDQLPHLLFYGPPGYSRDLSFSFDAVMTLEWLQVLEKRRQFWRSSNNFTLETISRKY